MFVCLFHYTFVFIRLDAVYTHVAGLTLTFCCLRWLAVHNGAAAIVAGAAIIIVFTAAIGILKVKVIVDHCRKSLHPSVSTSSELQDEHNEFDPCFDATVTLE